MKNAASLNDDRTIDSILGCVPFFCIGIMALGSFTVILVLRRVHLAELYLYLSSFFAFVAVILTLGQVLAQGVTGTLDPSFLQGLTIAREVSFALSVGLNYLFLWHLVAQRPPCEQSPRVSSTLLHSASWKQWGRLGLVLKWSLLALTLVIPVLQMVWRISSLRARFRMVYIADATIEIIVSSLFLLKLILNACLSPLTHWWRRVRLSITPALALLISVALGIGNVVDQMFSETTLGRFLRAVELYTLIIYGLITSFSSVSSNGRDPQDLFVADYLVKMANASPRAALLGQSTSISDARTNWPSRVSTLSWILPSDVQPMTAKQDIEFGLPSDTRQTSVQISNSGPNVRSRQLAPEATFRTLPGVFLPNEMQENLLEARPLTDASIYSYYAMESNSPTSYRLPQAPANQNGTSSPVYGLNGIERGNIEPLSRNSRTKDLYGRQGEINFPRRFPSKSAGKFNGRAVPASLPSSTSRHSNPLSATPSLGHKHESESSRSDFSLSNFPEPPMISVGDFGKNAKPMERTTRRRSLSIQLPIISAFRASDSELSSLPVSPGRLRAYMEFGSAGTQYDVTSFIGGLTLPSSRDPFSGRMTVSSHVD